MRAAPEGPILVVDDDPALRRSSARVLAREGYEVVEAASVSEARSVLEDVKVPIVLLDVNMPEESGLVLLSELSGESPRTVCIMVTAADSRDLGEAALEHGAYGYVIKPFSPNEILITVSNGIRRRRLELDQLEQQERLQLAVTDRTRDLWNSSLQLERREDQLRLANVETVRRLALAAEFRDIETAHHVERVGDYAAVIARTTHHDEDYVTRLTLAAALHDIGKIGVPDGLLRKPGTLTREERKTMQSHTLIGHAILSGASFALLDMAASIALTHHEHWDGSGYPRGLAGDDIPLEGRITAIADVFDALTSDRVYRKAYHPVEAVQMMKKGRGAEFDPVLLDAFVTQMHTVLDINEVEPV
ncbi:MAG TPA: HD domain-containing phosphohydrolase [Actinomycetota bacterium]|nr:HD domain-containing phosphohydrolase [Actinomycetota bacterium]